MWPLPLTSRACVSPSATLQRPVTCMGSSNGVLESWVRFAPSMKGGAVKQRSSRKGQRVQRQLLHPNGASMTSASSIRLLVAPKSLPETVVRPQSWSIDGGDPDWARNFVTGLAGVDDGVRGHCLLLLAPACAPLSVSALGGLSEPPASLTLLGWRTPPLPRVRRRPPPGLCRLRPTGPRSAGCTW